MACAASCGTRGESRNVCTLLRKKRGAGAGAALAEWRTSFLIPMSTPKTISLPAPGPAGWRAARDFLVSLRLTIVLLGFSMVLVFVATLDQVNLGVWAVQEKYFRSFVVYTPVGRFMLPVFPGGYTIGGLLLANLIAAHVFRFAFAWRKAGIVLTHLGLIVLLIGELLSGLWQEDFHLRLTEGETKGYAESFRRHELVVIDTTHPDFDDIVAVPETLLARKMPVQHPKLPFRVGVKSYYANSSLHLKAAGGVENEGGPAAAPGAGDHLVAAPQPVTHRPDEQNVPSATIELAGPDGVLGTFLVSAHLPTRQTVAVAGRTFELGLRLRRVYRPFSLTLLKFSHDRYPGTEIPRNFSSRVRLATAGGRDDREVLISMNHPLRHGGLTFYQAGFENDDRTTILQVVRNPSWIVPYVACALMTLGLGLQFGIHLVAFVGQRRGAAVPATSAAADAPAAVAANAPSRRPNPAVPQTA